MNCKTDKIRMAWAAGDQIGALRTAARFYDRSNDTLIFKRGMAAQNNPGFYRQLGKEPAQIVSKARSSQSVQLRQRLRRKTEVSQAQRKRF